MRKIVLGVVAFVFVLAGVGCGSSSDKGSKTTLIPPVTVTRPSTSDCALWASQYADVMSQYVSALSGIDSSDASAVSAAVAAGRQGVITGRALIAACPQYSSASSKIDELEDSLNSAG